MPDREIVVCPACRYGFVDRTAADSHEFLCPRLECGHSWDAASQTIRAVHAETNRVAVPELVVLAGEKPQRVELREGDNYIGRESICLLKLENLNISRRHARLIRQLGKVWVEDSGSAAGTLLNGVPLRERQPVLPGDTLIIGGATLQLQFRYEAASVGARLVDNERVLSAGLLDPQLGGAAANIIPLTKARLTMGRSPTRDVILPDPMISANHALFEQRNDEWFLSDVQSRIGTFVNRKSIIRQRLEQGDRIQIGPYLFLFTGNRLERLRQLSSMAVTAVDLCKTVRTGPLIDHLSLYLQPGEFVGLLGPSGAGKTTLLDALNGQRPAHSGTVLINGDPLYAEYERLRHLIGYVPQEDIIHRELTCRQTLEFAGKLRLPKDITPAELEALVDQVLASLDLTARADVQVARLSGGQRKRISIGTELLTKPGIIFLDEPTSGLDPSTESRMMRMFQVLAAQGRTVVCTTHVMENVDLFDKIVVLVPGGRLAYFGPGRAAKAYFGIEKFTALYDQLEKKTPLEWQQKYAASEFYRELIAPQVQTNPGPAELARVKPTAPPTAFLSQLNLLCTRNWRILQSDPYNLLLLAAQPIVIVGLICLVCSDLSLILFLLVIAGLWFGCSNAAQEIVKERTIFRRERMVNLRLDAYVLSKFLLATAICTLQCLLMFMIVALTRGLAGNIVLEFAALWLAALNGIALGLIISSLASTPDKAMFIVPLSLLPQFILGGVLVALPAMSTPTRVASYAIVSRWANQTMEAAVMNGQEIKSPIDDEDRRPLWNLHPEYDFREPQDLAKFMREQQGQTVKKSAVAFTGISVLLSLLIAQLLSVGAILKWREAH